MVYFLVLSVLGSAGSSRMSLDSRFRGNDGANESDKSSNTTATIALLSALLFAVHPVHSESISWIAGVTDPLMTLFLLGSFLAFMRYSENHKQFMLVFSLGLYCLALLTKETAVMLPFILIAWVGLNDGLRLRDRQWLISLGAFAVLLASYFIIRKIALGNTIALNNINLEGFATLILFTGEYIKLLFAPWPMNYYYAVPAIGILQIWGGITALLIVSGVIFTIIKYKKQRNLLLFSSLGVCMTLLPSLSLAFHDNAGFSIRFLYLPSVGLVIFLAVLLVPVYEKYKTRVLAASGVVVVIFSIITMSANRIWQDEPTFYNHAQQVTPQHAGPVSGLAKYYQRNKQNNKAIEYYLQTAKLGNNHVKSIAYENIGLIYGIQGDINKSTQYYQNAYQFAPKRSTILVGLGNNAWSRKDMKSAETFYLQAYNTNSRNYEAAYNLSLLYRNIGDMNRAMLYQQKAQQLRVK